MSELLRKGSRSQLLEPKETLSEGRGRDSHQSGNELFNILVRNESAKVVEGSSGSLLDIRLGVPDSVGHGRDNVGHETSALIGSGDDELVDDLESTDLDLPLSSSSDLLEEDGEEGGDSPGGRNLNNRFGGLDGGLTNDLLLIGKGFGNDGVHELLEEERLNSVTETLFDEDREEVESSLTNT